MSKVIFITVQIYTESIWLNSKMLQITRAGQYQLSDKNYPVVVVKNYDEINQYLDQADWLVIETAGDVIINRDHLWNKIHTLTEDIGVMGHIIWYPDEKIPHLHDQCFIINTKAFKKLNFENYSDYGPKFVRGPGDMNCGHAPLSVYLGEFKEERTMIFGSSIMEDALLNGFRVTNFDEGWRYPRENFKFISIEDLVEDLGFDTSRYRLPARGHFYAKIRSKNFEHCLKTLTLNDDLDESQVMIISIIKKALEFNYLNVWHWDNHPPHVQASTVISPANGLLGESMTLTSNAKKIVFYDLNPNNINFKQALYKEWDGKDYAKFAEEWVYKNQIFFEPHLDSAQQESLKYQGMNDKILNNWSYFKNLEVEFYNFDMISNIDIILEKMDHALLHTSTILNYFLISNVLHDQEKINTVRNLIEKKCLTSNSIWYEST